MAGSLIQFLPLGDEEFRVIGNICLEKMGGRWGDPISKNPPTFRSTILGIAGSSPAPAVSIAYN